MRLAQLLACCVLVLCLHGGTALKCRTDEHQTNSQFQKVMHRCRDRILQDSRKIGDQNSSDADDDDDDDDDENYDDESPESDEKNFDKKFMNGRTATTDSSSMRNSGSNNNGNQNSNSRRHDSPQQNSTPRPYPYNRMMSNVSSGGADSGNDRLSRNNTNLRNGGTNGMGNSGHNDMQTNQQDQACVIQCFFDELNLIDRNGFPEKSAVTKIMTQNIRDRELQEFIEEAVMDCFYLIDADKNKEQCKFSQNLLNCLADKGRERCEDWDSD